MAGSPATPEGRGCARDGRVNFKRSRSRAGRGRQNGGTARLRLEDQAPVKVAKLPKTSRR
jgi:hypothetical protein